MRIRITVLAATLQLLLTFSLVVGQRVGGGEGSVAPTRKTSAPMKIITKYITKPVTPTTGRLFVAAEPNAVLLVEAKNVRNAEAQQGTVPAGRRDFIFNDLKPGRYRVAGTLPGYHEAETEIQIKANVSGSVTLNFEEIFYTLTINTNIKTGEVRYGPDGQALTRVATIQNQTGQLKLPAGKYAFEIAPGDFGYKPLRNTLSLTKDETIQLALERVVITEKTLSPTWTRAELQEWEMPPGWQADAKRNLLIKGRGVGIPREARNRYYKDFRLETNVRMVNGVGVSFALRARDTENFYLLQLTGEKSEEPFVIRLLVVKNGQPRRLQAIPISRSSAKVMTAGGFFNLSVKMVDYDITVQITDSVTGAPYTLGMLTDADHNFPLGAVGIAAGDNEESVIERFVVCTGKCLNE